jgi:hypothetical protein
MAIERKNVAKIGELKERVKLFLTETKPKLFHNEN